MRFPRIKNLLPLYKEFFDKYRWKIVFLIILGFLSGFLESISIGLLMPLFSMIVKGGDFGSDFISRNVKTLFALLHAAPNLWVILFLFTFLFLLSAGISFLFGYLENKIHVEYEKGVRSRLYRNVLSSSWPFLIEQKMGYLNYVLMSAVTGQSKVITNIFSIIKTLTGFIMYFFVALNISTSITLITTMMGGLLVLCFRPLAKRMEAYTRSQVFLGTAVAHDIDENITGFKTIKSFGVEEEVAGKSLDLFDQMKNISIKQFLVEKIFPTFWQPLTLIFISIVFSISYLHDKAHFDLAAFVTVMYLIQRVFVNTSKFQGVSFVLSRSLPNIELVVNLREATLNNQEYTAGSRPFSFNHLLEFRDVSFSYGEDPVLVGLNLAVRRGEMVGIVGPSGVGKTTLFDLILRLFQPVEGGIHLDGNDISEFNLKEWRKNIGYVSQDIFLKNDSVENNIKFFDNRITDKEMVEAAKMANIYDFIAELPKGFQTIVGERGIFFSSGQRQRIILARVLAKKPKVLLLDEATSALDNESEVLIQNAIEKLKGGLTIITIAHRLSTVMHSDRLLALDNGRIIEEGKPTDLLKDKNSYFYKMYNIIDV